MRLSTACVTFCALLAVLLGCGSVCAAADEWRAGAAKINITPEKLMWMSGYGGRDKPAEGKLTDLWAKVLVLKDAGGRRAVLVTLDLVGIDRGISVRVGQRLKEKYGLDRDQVALSTSHTHTGPVVGENLRAMYFYGEDQAELVRQYTAALEDKIVAVVGDAIGALAPARLSWGRGLTTFAVNRRNNREGDVPKLREEGKLRGPVDHDVPVLAVRDTNDQLRAVVCGYACHATVLSFYQWSGDWPGFAQIELEKRHPGAIALVWAGCGADQNPLPRRQVELAEKYGAMIADSVDEAMARGLQPVSGTLATEYAEIALPFQHVPTREELEQDLDSKNRYIASRAKMLLQRLDDEQKLSPTYPYPVQAWQIGNGPTLVTLGGEVVVDFALRLKGELGLGRTWVMGYANDVMAYIPSRRVLQEGGYEGGGAMLYYGLPSPWGPDVEKLIVDEVHRQVAAVRSEADAVDRPTPHYPDHSKLLVYRDQDGQEHAIESPSDWPKRREHILDGIQQAMGELPDRLHEVPLEIRELKREKGDGYTRLLISYVAEPGDRVPAHLYLPDGHDEGVQRPAMLALHPTSALGKLVVANESERPNRGYAKELAQRGYLVLAPDYPSFGDYKEYDFSADRYVSGSMKGIVNHIRGVDLLAQHDDVDPDRIGVIGHSLGGHNAMFVGVFDPRLKVIVSSCGWTPFHDYYGGKLAGWTSDRYMPRIRDEYGLDSDRVPFDFYEIVAALAPRAFFSCSPLHDGNFDVAGIKKAIPKAAEVYKLLGAEKQLVVRYPDAEHDFPDEVREEAYSFIDTVLGHQKPAVRPDDEG